MIHLFNNKTAEQVSVWHYQDFYKLTKGSRNQFLKLLKKKLKTVNNWSIV